MRHRMENKASRAAFGNSLKIKGAIVQRSLAGKKMPVFQSKPWFSYLILMLILAFSGVTTLSAQKGHRELLQGDKAYEKGAFETAESSYQSAIDQRNSVQGNYNLGNAAYQQGKFEDAARRFEEAARLAQNPSIQSYAYHNLGNAYFQQKEYAKAVEAYKNALRRTPDDLETKHNLSKAMQMIPPPQEQEQPSEGDQKKEKEEEKDEQKEDEEQQNQDQPSQEQQKEPSPEQQAEQASSQPDKKMTREEAERQLEYAEEAEKKTLEEIQRKQERSCNSNKKW